MFKSLLIMSLSLVFVGCTGNLIVTTSKSLPAVYHDVNETHEEKLDIPVALFRLQNYTDTPRAGMRAANILEGLLNAKGYRVISYVGEKTYSFKKARKKAKADKAKYFIYGGVSEWRYKTGIDGEPAVSMQLGLYRAKNGKLVWSATGSDSDWGNGSIGTTAQDLLVEMLER